MDSPVKQPRSSSFLTILLAAAVFFGSGFLTGQQYHKESSPTNLKLDKLSEVYKTLQESYLFKNSLDPEKLEYGAIKGLVEAAGDPYTYFLNPKESADFFEMINGSFQGIGAEIGLNDQRQITIIAPLEGTPAKRAGLQPQDIILQIDDKLTAGLSLDQAVGIIRGPKGSALTLVIKRQELADPVKLVIVRDVIEIPIATLKPLQNADIAYVQLFNFNEKSSNRFNEVAQKILSSSAKKLVIDLRGNPGGILQEAIKIAGWFIEKDKVIVSEKEADGTLKDYKSEGPGKLKDFPLVILVDKGSASASEILAGALRANNKAPLVGEKTFGKGTVQVLERYKDGSSLRVTIAQWLLPDGSSINKEGLQPDTFVASKPDNKKQDAQLQKAIEILSK